MIDSLAPRGRRPPKLFVQAEELLASGAKAGREGVAREGKAGCPRARAATGFAPTERGEPAGGPGWANGAWGSATRKRVGSW